MIACRDARAPAVRALGAALLALSLVVLVLTAGVGPAAGHGGAGQIVFETVEPTADLELEVGVFISYVSDGHPAIPATIDLTATAADGTTVGPLPMEQGQGEGFYRLRLQVPSPGDWSLHAESTLPPAVADEAVGVVDPDAPVDTSDTTAVPFDPNALAGGPTTAPPAPVVAARSGSETPTGLLAGLAVFGVLAAGGIFLLLRSRRNATPR